MSAQGREDARCGPTLKVLLCCPPWGAAAGERPFFSPAEHVCSGLAGAKGGAESPEPAEQVFQQHHGALQG